MPRTTKTGKISTDVYAGRVILTMPPHGSKEQPVIGFLVATHTTVRGETVGLAVDREQKSIPADAFKKLTATVRGANGKPVKITGESWLEAVGELFDGAYAKMTAPQPSAK